MSGARRDEMSDALYTWERRIERHRARSFARRRWFARAAVALILRDAPTGVEVLLVRRAIRRGDRWSGHLALPGGLEQPGDLDAPSTAVRETLEETGIDLAAVARPLGPLSEVVTARHASLAPLIVAPWAFVLVESGPLSLGPELSAADWVAVDGLRERRAARSSIGRAAGWISRRRGEPVGGGVLWGLTLAIVDELLGIDSRADPELR